MRSLILALVLVPGVCACGAPPEAQRATLALPTSEPVPAEVVGPHRGRVIFSVSGAHVFPVACFDQTTARFGGCMALVRPGETIDLFGEEIVARATLGVRVRQFGCEGCYADDGFDIDPESLPEGLTLLGGWPVGVGLDVRTTQPPGEGGLRVEPFAARALSDRARAYFERVAASGASMPPITADIEVSVSSRLDADMDGDGAEDRLYVVTDLSACPSCYAHAWNAIVLERGGTTPSLTVLRESARGSYALTATLELDGRAPREVVYTSDDPENDDVDGHYGAVARIEGDRLVEIGATEGPCPP